MIITMQNDGWKYLRIDMTYRYSFFNVSFFLFMYYRALTQERFAFSIPHLLWQMSQGITFFVLVDDEYNK